MHGHEAPHTPTNGLAVSPGIIRSRPHPPRHVYCGHGRPSHLPVPWGRRTSGTAGHQFWRLQTIRNGAPCNRRDPRPHQMPMAGQVGSWGIQQDPSSRVEPPRSIATHQKPQLGSAKFGAKQPKSSTRGRFEGVMHGHEAPHTPTNGLAVSPGIMRSWDNPPRHVYCGHGRPSHLPLPWGRRTSGTAGHQIWRLQTIRDGAPCNGRDPRPIGSDS